MNYSQNMPLKAQTLFPRYFDAIWKASESSRDLLVLKTLIVYVDVPDFVSEHH